MVRESPARRFKELFSQIIFSTGNSWWTSTVCVMSFNLLNQPQYTRICSGYRVPTSQGFNTTRGFFAAQTPLISPSRLSGQGLCLPQSLRGQGPGARQREVLPSPLVLGQSAFHTCSRNLCQGPRGYFRYCFFTQNKPHGHTFTGDEKEQSYLISKGENENIQKQL